jgi:DNA gyrase/topoisomerase IV subunit A
VVIELKRDAIAKVVINNLYQHTSWRAVLLRTCWRLTMGARRS